MENMLKNQRKKKKRGSTEESRRLNTSEFRLTLLYQCLLALLPCFETDVQTLPPSWGPGGHLGHALLLQPKSYLTYPPCCRHHVYFSSSGLLKIITGQITVIQEMVPLFDHSKIIVSDFSIMSMFSLPPIAPPSHSKVTLKAGFIFRGLFRFFFLQPLKMFSFDTHGRLFPP